MTAPQIRDALLSLTDRELTLLWHVLPGQVRICVADALHASLDRLAAAEADLDEWFPDSAS